MIALVLQALRISVPYGLAAAGGTLCERGGVINIALEGMMLAGAFGAAAAAIASGSLWVGLAGGLAAALACAALLALATVWLRADAIVAGVAINLLVEGATRFALRMLYDSSSNSPRIAAEGNPLLPLAVAAVALVAAAHVALFRTPWGLRLRSAGEHPEAARSLGLGVARLRAGGVLISGALAGLAGVWLAFDQRQFTDGMSGGRGYIALAAVIFGKWRPLYAGCACLLFGAAEAAQIALQGRGGVPAQFVQTIPYLLTIVTLAGAIGRARPPAALGKPLD